MIRPFSFNHLGLRRVVIVALLMWLGGLNCVLCCGQNALALAPADESCAAAHNAESPSCADDCGVEPNHGEENPAPCEDGCCLLDAPAADLPHAPQGYGSSFNVTAANRQTTAPEIASPINTARLRPPAPRGQSILLHCCTLLI